MTDRQLRATLHDLAREWNPGDSRALPDAPESAYPPDAVPLDPPRPLRSTPELHAALDDIEARLAPKHLPVRASTLPPLPEDEMNKLRCAVCMFTHLKRSDQNDADTVLNGYAVCLDHVGLVQNSRDIARHELFAHGDGITSYTVDENGNT